MTKVCATFICIPLFLHLAGLFTPFPPWFVGFYVHPGLTCPGARTSDSEDTGNKAMQLGLLLFWPPRHPDVLQPPVGLIIDFPYGTNELFEAFPVQIFFKNKVETTLQPPLLLSYVVIAFYACVCVCFMFIFDNACHSASHYACMACVVASGSEIMVSVGPSQDK